jgi:hypothetical protein
MRISIDQAAAGVMRKGFFLAAGLFWVAIALNATAQTATAAGAGPDESSPVDFFRRLMEMDSSERKKALAEKTEQESRYIQTRLRQYELMPLEEREIRLRILEMRWYLVPLMRADPEERDPQLERLPELERRLIRQRLEFWDQLPAALQRDILENGVFIQFFIPFETSSPAQKKLIREKILQRSSLASTEPLAKWRTLPPEQRRKMFRHFQEFFQLPNQEKEKTLQTMSETERRKMEQTLKAFERLSPRQRRDCIESFRRFASMSDAEIAQFLKNVERWKAMTPGERKTWRELVTRLPPLPPGLTRPPLPPGLGEPPVPPGIRPGRPQRLFQPPVPDSFPETETPK